MSRSGHHHVPAPNGRARPPYARSSRVNEVLREILADEIERLADADERLRLVTITSVETSGDLRHADVYLVTLTETVSQALGERRSQLQAAIGRQVRMKRTPRLVFTPDPAIAAGERVEEILRRLHGGREDTDAGPDGGTGKQ